MTIKEIVKGKAFNIVVMVVILTGCIIYLYNNFSWGKTIELLSLSKKKWNILLCIPLILMYWSLRAYRWNIFLRKIGINEKLFNIYIITVISLSVSIITPFQSGEAIKIEMLKKKNNRIMRSSGYTIFYVEKLMDLVTVLILLSVSSLKIFGILGMQYVTIALIIIILFAVLGFFLFSKFFKIKVSKFIGVLMPFKKEVCKCFSITILSWVIIAWLWSIMLEMLDIRLGNTKLFFIMSAVTMLGVLSSVPGNIGLAEVSIIKLLILFGIKEEIAQACAISLRLLTVIILLMGFMHYLAKKGYSIVAYKSLLEESFKNDRLGRKK